MSTAAKNKPMQCYFLRLFWWRRMSFHRHRNEWRHKRNRYRIGGTNHCQVPLSISRMQVEWLECRWIIFCVLFLEFLWFGLLFAGIERECFLGAWSLMRFCFAFEVLVFSFDQEHISSKFFWCWSRTFVFVVVLMEQ